jgi:hypothetical protein
VQGFIVGPTPKPDSFCCFNKTLFNKNDFPVRYFPTKDINPILLNIGLFKISLASSVITNSIIFICYFIFLNLLPPEYITNGKAIPLSSLSISSFIFFKFF